ncbi:MAG: hypothetical protein ACE5H2_05110 [Terriglobia bacterium]
MAILARMLNLETRVCFGKLSINFSRYRYHLSDSKKIKALRILLRCNGVTAEFPEMGKTGQN